VHNADMKLKHAAALIAYAFASAGLFGTNSADGQGFVGDSFGTRFEWAVFSKNGKLIKVLPFDHVSAEPNCEAAAVEKATRGDTYENWTGFIAPDGHTIVEPKFPRAYPFTEGLGAACTKSGSWGFIDITGKFVIQPQFSNAWPFQEGLASVQIPGKGYGFIDRSGELVIQPKYHDPCSFSGGIAKARVKPDGDWIYFDKGGQEIEHSQSWYDPGDGLVFIPERKAFVDTSGTVVARSAIGGTFSEGMAVVIDKKCKQGYIDRTGKITIEPSYERATPFHEGVAAVEIGNRKWKLIDKKGNVLFGGRTFASGCSFSQGYAIADIDGCSSVIDRSGNRLCTFKRRHIVRQFGNNLIVGYDADAHITEHLEPGASSHF